MKYTIELSRVALKTMSKLPRRELVRIQARIDSLSSDPRPSDIKKVQGDSNLYRIRSGNYRVLYRIYDDQILILIVDVDHRKDIYKF
jgi:mRNA interferase RelE/StbE